MLSDEQKRAKYDRFGHAANDMNQGGGYGGGGMNVDDIFRNFGDIFGDIFSGRGGRQQAYPDEFPPGRGRQERPVLS